MRRRRTDNNSKLSLARCLSRLFLCVLCTLRPAVVSADDDFNQDDRCYLSNGGSSETFTVREDLAVGSIVGALPIPGDPSETGDIELMLSTNNTPIEIQPGTKNLVLQRPLDKEKVTGSASVLLEVACSRREETNDPSITIPVRIIVTDVNDNAPMFVAAPYSVNISEVTVVGSTVIQGIKAVDKDQFGPFSTVEYHVLSGPHAHLVVFENRLEGHLILAVPLDYETLTNFTVNIRAQDQGEPPQMSDTTLTVWVQDADDQNPKFLEESYVAVLPDNYRPGSHLITKPSPIKAQDPDEGIQAPIQYSFNSDSSEYSYFEVNRRTGEVSVRKQLPENMRLPLTMVIRATQIDNPDRYSLTTLTVDSEHAMPMELKFLHSVFVSTVGENAPIGQVVTTIQISKPHDKNVRLQLFENPTEDFAVRNTGEIVVAKELDYERQTAYSMRIVASDGSTTDVARVNITVMNVNDNDPKFDQLQYNFQVKQEDVRIGSLIGTIKVTDGDINDSIELNVKGPFARVFSISHRGELRVRSLDFLNASTCHLIVVATDNGMPPRQTSVPITVQFPEDVAQSSVHRVKKADSSLVLMIVFGVLLGTLLVVIITLTIYILKTKQYRDRIPNSVSSNHSSANKMSNYMTGNGAPPSKPNGHIGNGGIGAPQNGVENPVFTMTDGNKNENQRNGIPPAPAEVSAWKVQNGSAGTLGSTPNGLDRDILAQNGTFVRAGSGVSNGKIQNVYWPNGSIPRRVKKLSWEDEQSNRTELDPDVSVTPMGKQPDIDTTKQPGLTVYF